MSEWNGFLDGGEWLDVGYVQLVAIPTHWRVHLVAFHPSSTTFMAPYSRWVLPSFRETLLGNCDTYLESSDCGNDKTRSKLIAQVAQEINAIAQAKGEPLPDDLEKVVHSSRRVFHNAHVSL